MNTKRNLINLTKDGLPVVDEGTLIGYLKTRGITRAENNPEVTKRIQEENPEIYRVLNIGKKQAPSDAAESYFECGVQLTYELLRRQSLKNK